MTLADYADFGPDPAEVVVLDARTRDLLDRRQTGSWRHRGWLIRRALIAADVAGLFGAFAVALLAFGNGGALDGLEELALFVGLLPLWVLVGKLSGLYDRDEERTEHSTVDEFAGVLHLVTLGSWMVVMAWWLTGIVSFDPPRMLTFWVLAILLVAGGRAVARHLCRRSLAYLQNTVIVGAGDVGQLIARKFVQHPEYGINLVGLVDSRPRARRADLAHVTLLGPPERLPDIIRTFDVERVVIAFSNESDRKILELLEKVRGFDIQIDIVPRLFHLVGPRVGVHAVEGLPLIGLPPARMARWSRRTKRAIDILGASVALAALAPLFALIAWRIHRDSPGPVFFRQTRLGMDRREFTLCKFRTMRVDTDDRLHREYIAATMSASAAAGENGLYKLDRRDAVTDVGQWLRRTSLDELPQLINVLRGDMSLVGPRPCLQFETEHFAAHHFERFLVPAGLTGLWQVTARAHATFGEALDMDVSYVRGWSLGLDLRLLCRTPVQLLRRPGTA